MSRTLKPRSRRYLKVRKISPIRSYLLCLLLKLDKPIIFAWRKAQPDVCFFVFGQEYHVCSAPLKFASELFQTYLEPSGGIDAAELNSMTEQADYYRALPALFNNLNGIFFNSPGLLATMKVDPATLLVSTYKLRHKILFRECFILSLGPWSNPGYKTIQVPVLVDIADRFYSALAKDIAALWPQLLQLAANCPDGAAPYERVRIYEENNMGQDAAMVLLKDAVNSVSKDNQVMLPKLFRVASSSLGDLILTKERWSI